MSNNKKPRKAYRPRQACTNTLDMVLHRVAKPAKEDRAEILDMVGHAFTAMREGVATELQWSIIAGAVATAMTIEKQGVVRGLQGHWQAANNALDSIYTRANVGGAWKPVALYFHEMDALREFVSLHAYQVSHLSRAEWMRAIKGAGEHIRAQGHTVTMLRNTEGTAA